MEEDIQKKKEIADHKHNFSGFWVRVAAHLIDGFVVNFGALAVQLVLGIIGIVLFGFSIGFTELVNMFDDENFSGVFIAAMIVLIYIVPFVLYYGYFIYMTYKYGATLGKMAVGIRVTDIEGKSLTLGRTVLRETIGKIISALIIGIGYFMAGWTPKKQGLHDMMANSTVSYKDPVKRANKIVVGLVLGVYGFIIIAVLAFVGIFAGSGLSGALDAYEYEEYDSQYYNPFDDAAEDVLDAEENFEDITEEKI